MHIRHLRQYFFFFPSLFYGCSFGYMEVPRLGGKVELQQLAYAGIHDLHCCLQQCWILKPLSEARDRTWLLIDTIIKPAEPQRELQDSILISSIRYEGLRMETFFFLRLHLWHTEVPRLGVNSELQLPAYTTATVTRDLSCVCDLHYSSQQRRILNPLSEVRDQTQVLSDTGLGLLPLNHRGTPRMETFYPKVR